MDFIHVLEQKQKQVKEGEILSVGVTEGACRDLINDRSDITEARWGFQGLNTYQYSRRTKGAAPIRYRAYGGI